MPKELNNFFKKVIKQLYSIHPFQLAILDFEVSGQYYLDSLKSPLLNAWTPSSFYVGQNNYEIISQENRKFVTKIEDITTE